MKALMLMLVFCLCLIMTDHWTCNASEAADPWTTEQKVLQVAYTALHFADTLQTLQIARQPEKYWERNPLLGKHPSEGKVYGYMAASYAAELLVAHYLASKYRTWFLGGATAFKAGLVIHNSSIGLRVGGVW